MGGRWVLVFLILGFGSIIIDARKAQPEMSVNELYSLAVELSNWRAAFSRNTAVLGPIEHFDEAAFFALCAQNRNFPIQAFTSFEEAIEWLIADRITT